MATTDAWRWRVDAFEIAASSGVFGPDARVELVEGEVYQLATMLPGHAATLRALRAALAGVDPGAWTLDTQTPVRLSARSEPEPDLWMARGPHERFDTRHPGPDDLALVVEVADTSLAYDREVKVPAYAAAAIPETWIISLPERCVHRHRDPLDGRYQDVVALAGGILSVAGVDVDVATVLRPAAR